MPIIIDGLDNPNAVQQTVDAIKAMAQAHCAYCKAGLDRHAETGGQTFIHILTRGADGQVLKWRPCTRAS